MVTNIIILEMEIFSPISLGSCLFLRFDVCIYPFCLAYQPPVSSIFSLLEQIRH